MGLTPNAWRRWLASGCAELAEVECPPPAEPSPFLPLAVGADSDEEEEEEEEEEESGEE